MSPLLTEVFQYLEAKADDATNPEDAHTLSELASLLEQKAPSLPIAGKVLVFERHGDAPLRGKIEAVRAIRWIYGIGLVEAKKLVEGGSFILCEADAPDMGKLQKTLEEAGAVVELREGKDVTHLSYGPSSP